MNVKILLKPLAKYISPVQNKMLSVENSSTLKNNCNSSDEISLDYQYSVTKISSRGTITTSTNETSSKVLDVKFFISNSIGARPDSIQLYYNGLNEKYKFKTVFDSEEFSKYIDLSQSNHMQLKNSNEKVSISVLFFYKLAQETLRVIVDFNQMSIESIGLDLFLNCSILMLKQMIITKLSNYLLDICDLSIFGIGVIDNKSQAQFGSLVNSNCLTNKEFSDDISLLEIVQYYLGGNKTQSSNLSTESMSINSQWLAALTLNLLLIKKNKTKCSIGLDFRFNCFNNFTKVEFDETAPSFREVGDGINLLIFCRNSSCQIFGQFFARVLGYGSFDILQEMACSFCPKCKSSTIGELRNIGFVNSKWYYKGVLTGKKSSYLEGDGFTVDNKLYVLPETNFSSHLARFLIKVEPYLSKPIQCHYEEKRGSGDLDSLSLYLPDETQNEIPKIENKRLKKNNERMLSFDIRLDKRDNNNNNNICSCLSVFSCDKNKVKDTKTRISLLDTKDNESRSNYCVIF